MRQNLQATRILVTVRVTNANVTITFKWAALFGGNVCVGGRTSGNDI